MRYLGRSAVGVGLLVGCPGAPPQETGTGSTDTSTTTTTPPPPPTLAIAAPVSGAALAGPDVAVTLEIGGFILDGYQPPGSTTGALWGLGPLWSWSLLPADAHVTGEPPRGFPLVRLDGIEVSRDPSAALVLAAVPPGAHFLEVELLWYDGDAFFPPVIDGVSFTIAPPATGTPTGT
jgi:hypothetical protein